MDVITCRSIPSVPLMKELIDSTLSKTQRKTPTEIHKNYDIVKIRNFYMRKVRFTQQTFHDKLTQILESFPKIDNIHPFYSDLFNILYDKDHYKIALGKVNLSKTLIDNTSRDYVRLLKYGDSLFRCKTLKKIALGKMVKVVKKLGKTLDYLEEVRKHISRLPTIDPSGNTIILAGFPNTGKSSFLNKVSNANVEVEPYPFTTKSLYIGQTIIHHINFQVIDTPGVLDTELEQRNTIEMQSITAIAHLKACILFMIDISETCGYSISEQIKLFESLNPIIKNKKIIIGLNKIDIMDFESLATEIRDQINVIRSDTIEIIPISTLNNINLDRVLDTAYKFIIDGNKFSEKLYIARPKVNKIRETFIPEKLKQDLINGCYNKCLTQKDIAKELGEDYCYNEKERYLIEGDEKYDTIPEIFNGKNISDFIDVNISEKIKKLTEEELARDKAGYYNVPKWSEREIQAYYDREHVTDLRLTTMKEHTTKKSSKGPQPRVINERVKKFQSKIGENLESSDEEIIKIPEIESYDDKYKEKLISSGINESKLKKCNKIIRKSRISSNLLARAGDGDRHVYDLKPRHLFSGKRKAGKTQRR